MKTFTKLAILLTSMGMVTSPTFGQTTIPNGNFEAWQNTSGTSIEPTNWNGNKTGGGFASSGPQTCFREGTNPHTGAYCLKLANGDFFGTGINATATTGRIEAPTTQPTAGYIRSKLDNADFFSPFSGRPDSLVGWYRNAQGGTDLGRVYAILHDSFNVSNPDQGGSVAHMIGEALFDLPTGSTTTWTRFSVPFTYTSGATPKYILLIATASKVAGSANVNTVLWVDDLEAVYCTPDASVTDNGNSLTANAVGVTYQWVDCNNANAPVSGATSATFTPTVSGNYAVEVTSNGCMAISTCYNITVSSLDKLAFANNLAVYPNPTTGQFTMDLGATYNDISVVITDINGKTVHTANYNQSQLLNLNLDQPAGMYFVAVTSETAHAVVKLIKQ